MPIIKVAGDNGEGPPLIGGYGFAGLLVGTRLIRVLIRLYKEDLTKRSNDSMPEYGPDALVKVLAEV